MKRHVLRVARNVNKNDLFRLALVQTMDTFNIFTESTFSRQKHFKTYNKIAFYVKHIFTFNKVLLLEAAFYRKHPVGLHTGDVCIINK